VNGETMFRVDGIRSQSRLKTNRSPIRQTYKIISAAVEAAGLGVSARTTSCTRVSSTSRLRKPAPAGNRHRWPHRPRTRTPSMSSACGMRSSRTRSSSPKSSSNSIRSGLRRHSSVRSWNEIDFGSRAPQGGAHQGHSDDRADRQRRQSCYVSADAGPTVVARPRGRIPRLREPTAAARPGPPDPDSTTFTVLLEAFREARAKSDFVLARPTWRNSANATRTTST
jgi:hypothetical protein